MGNSNGFLGVTLRKNVLAKLSKLDENVEAKTRLK
jgi:hypothetical protein